MKKALYTQNGNTGNVFYLKIEFKIIILDHILFSFQGGILKTIDIIELTEKDLSSTVYTYFQMVKRCRKKIESFIEFDSLQTFLLFLSSSSIELR